ncbi:MAG: serine--tRNA ligase, partial [Alphaproteobacteria bacterium]|nr:serine--tRNA ligase [Alphaproteobacteria bacterium]
MHDIKLIRDNPKWLDNGLERRNLAHQSADIVKLDAERRALQTQLQEILQKRNDLSKQIGELKRSGGDATAITEEVAKLKALVPELEAK